MKRSELIADIREVLRSYSIDDEIADRHILFLIRTKRNKYIRQKEINSRGEYRNQLQQSVFLALEITDTSRYPGITTGGKILRTIKSLPNLVGRDAFKQMEIRTVDYLGTEVEILDKARVAYASSAPKGFIYCFREDDGKLYFFSKDPSHFAIEQVVVQCILEDPEEIVSLNSLTTPLEIYPITGDLWGIIRPEILSELAMSKGIPIDTLNDKADAPTPSK